MQQSTLVAAIVVITFALGFMSGRATAPQVGAPTPSPAPVAMAPPPQTPFPTPTQQQAPAAGPAAAAPAGDVAGDIAEVIQVPNYTYVRIATPHGDEWAAVNSDTSLSVGQRVALGHANKMENFASKTLNRTFDSIWFGELQH